MHIIDISWLFLVIWWYTLGHCLLVLSWLVFVPYHSFFSLIFSCWFFVYRLAIAGEGFVSFESCFSFASLLFPGRPFLPLGLAFCGRWRDSRLCFVRTIFVGRSFGVVPVWLTNGFLPLHRFWICIYLLATMLSEVCGSLYISYIAVAWAFVFNLRIFG